MELSAPVAARTDFPRTFKLFAACPAGPIETGGDDIEKPVAEVIVNAIFEGAFPCSPSIKD